MAGNGTNKSKEKQTSLLEVPSIWEDKTRTFPSSTSRLPLFLKKNKEETPFGIISLSKPLSQTHRDILEAIATAGEQGIRKNTNGQIAYLFDIRQALKILGHSSNSKNHEWFKNKLKEMATILLEIKSSKIHMVGHIIDKFFYSDEHKRKRQNNEKPKHIFGEDKLFVVVLSEEFSKLFSQDYIVWTKREAIQAIINIRYDFVKAVVRFCFTHEKINMCFNTMLKYIGHENDDKRTKHKYKKQLIEYAEYLYTNFGIQIKENENKLIILYEKNPNFVAIDYKKTE